jgi:O-antigen ligase
MFICTMSLVSIPMKIPVISGLANQLRWGLLFLMALTGFKYMSIMLRERLPAMHNWIVLLMMIGLVSCGYSIMPDYSIERWVSFLILWVAMFLGLWCWLKQGDNVFIGADIFYFIIITTSIITVLNLAKQDSSLSEDRLEGAFDKATAAGGFAALAIPFLLWKVRYALGPARYLAIFLMILQAYILFFSGARGALVSTVFSLGFIFWMGYRRFRVPFALIGAAVIGLAVMGQIGLDSLPDYIVRKQSLETMAGRVPRFKAMFYMWQKNPVLGYGYGVGRYLIASDWGAIDILNGGTSSSGKMEGIVKRNFGRVPMEIQPHNDHVERLAETGIFGYACYLGFWVCVLFRIPRMLKRPRGPLNDLAKFLCGAVWFIFMDSFLHSGQFSAGAGPTVLAWFCMTLALVADTLAELDSRPNNLIVADGITDADQNAASGAPLEGIATTGLEA